MYIYIYHIYNQGQTLKEDELLALAIEVHDNCGWLSDLKN